jgi:FAD/FMN-containing dehydrogenase
MPFDKTQAITALEHIIGTKHVISDPSDMASSLTDWRGDYQGKALAVVKPANTSEVSAILQCADALNMAVIPQGGNTSLCGGATPDDQVNNLILSTERLNAIRDIDVAGQTITVESGCILDVIKSTAAEHDLLFPLDLGARGTCRIGGNLSTNAGGLNVIRYGNMRDLTLGLEVVLMGGKVMNLLSSLKKNNTGYDLKNLFIGAEGTLGVITAATLKLFPRPQATATGFAGLRDIDAGIELLNRCQAASGGNVIAFELMPRSIIENVLHFYPDCQPPLNDIPLFSALIEIASTAEADQHPDPDGGMPLTAILTQTLADALESGLITDATIASNQAQQDALWAIRELTPESEIKAGKAYKSDISIPLRHMAAFYADAVTAVHAIAPDARIFGFGHIGDGNLHFNLCEPAGGNADFRRHYPDFDVIMLDLLKTYDGSISAEHGIGQKKREMLRLVKDPIALEVMQTIKQALDPKNLMNPGKVI